MAILLLASVAAAKSSTNSVPPKLKAHGTYGRIAGYIWYARNLDIEGSEGKVCVACWARDEGLEGEGRGVMLATRTHYCQSI